MVQAVFFDVDGTLLSHAQHSVPASTRRALDQLREQGIKRVLATGRHMLGLDMLPVKDIDFDGYITVNGQLCLDAQRNIISSTPIIGVSKESILHLFEEKKVPIMLVEKDAMYCNFINQSVVSAQQAISTPIPDVGVYTGNDIYQVTVFLEKGKENILSSQLPDCKITRWHDHAVDVISRQGGKASGIMAYLRFHHIPREDSMAFGDGENDIEMLEYVQTGVAMGNADDIVKGKSDFVTDTIDRDGVEKALIHLGVLK